MKRTDPKPLAHLIKKAVLFLLYHGGFGWISRLVYRRRARILMYHGITVEAVSDPTSSKLLPLEAFERQIRHLSRYYTIIPLDELVRRLAGNETLPAHSLVLTFDDGYRNNLEYAYPVLRKYNAPATIFLTTAFIGTADVLWTDQIDYLFSRCTGPQGSESLSWIADIVGIAPRSNQLTSELVKDRLKKMEDEKKQTCLQEIWNRAGSDFSDTHLSMYQFLSWEEVREMDGRLITFGAHTRTHPILTKIPREQAREEIAGSKHEIEERTGRSATLFAYPNGKEKDFDETTKALLKDAGFSCSLTTIPGFNAQGIDRYALHRLSPYAPDFITFKAKMAGMLELLSSARRMTK